MSVFSTVDSKSPFEGKCCNPEENITLNRNSDKTLKIQLPKKDSVDSLIANAKIGRGKIKIQLPVKSIIDHLTLLGTNWILCPS